MLIQIGNGTAFDPEIPNTSFLLKDFLLIDCGYNIFKELKENFDIGKIELIAITHNHADHIGSLETLLFYKKFKLDNNNEPTVILNRESYDVIKNINRVNLRRYIDGFVANFIVIDEGKTFLCIGDIKISAFTHTCHEIALNTTYAFTTKENGKNYTIVFTGDTKSSKEIEDFVKEVLITENSDYFLIFHDCSYNSSRVHATEEEFENTYSYWFKKATIKVHTGNINFKKYYSLNDFKESPFKR